MALAIRLDERAEFVRRARAIRPDVEESLPTPPPSLEEIGSEDLTGRAIRGYALSEKIGSGGMGAVYRAVQPIVKREVAIKIILPTYANHPDFIRRFEAEAQLVARLGSARAETAREVIPEELRKRGAAVEVVVCYRTVAPKVDPSFVKGIFKDGGVTVLTFTSSSTVKNFVEIVGPDAIGFLNGVCVACIGPVTKKTCEEMGINVSVVPRDYTVDSLLGALTEHFGRRKV